MSAVSALGRLRAAATGYAQPAATVRHRHLSDRPMVFVPYAMSGEAFAPLAALVGDDPAAPHLLVVPQPRDRDRRFTHVTELAAVLVPYLTEYFDKTETVERRNDDPYERALDAPQLIVPSPAGVEYVGLLGRSTRFRRPDGDYPVHPDVPLLGRWSTYLAERARTPGSSVLLAVTDLLTQAWATGQSDLENGELAALLGWIDPAPGRSGAEAARDAEGAPPAGPTTDPEFDARLNPLIAGFDAAQRTGNPRDAARAEERIRDTLGAELMPTWERVWRGLELLRELPAGASVAGRWETDRMSYSLFAHDLASPDSRPQPRIPGAVAAAQQLVRREQAQARLEMEQLRDDPLLMAEARLLGQAFRGEVVDVEADRMVTEPGKKQARPRPLLVVHTSDEPLLSLDAELECVERPKAKAKLLAVTDGPDGMREVTFELTGGMGRGKNPDEGSVPEEGEVLCWTLAASGFRGGPKWPAPEETPWTHGGPPESSTPDADAHEPEDEIPTVPSQPAPPPQPPVLPQREPDEEELAAAAEPWG
ncbi:hypothetical protein [Yinghuangia seranimata]|uniref:hypothetical protein n=1 Tax=Yinghuangia seranimata TaxID=408067 RepID=UPI00248C75C1|nr:hypothetical protein [Yinghuangia seranimata]MDI2132565.1 hypothetical protein [Yinghuangia seranimata]